MKAGGKGSSLLLGILILITSLVLMGVMVLRFFELVSSSVANTVLGISFLVAFGGYLFSKRHGKRLKK
jgi:uncharacterized SAM-binding protein YcdF (DUF218 family)